MTYKNKTIKFHKRNFRIEMPIKFRHIQENTCKRRTCILKYSAAATMAAWGGNKDDIYPQSDVRRKQEARGFQI